MSDGRPAPIPGQQGQARSKTATGTGSAHRQPLGIEPPCRSVRRCPRQSGVAILHRGRVGTLGGQPVFDRDGSHAQTDFTDAKDGVIRNRLQAQAVMATTREALKTFAVSRLLFDNVPHVKVFWVMHGLDTARLALACGADDIDGSVVEYKITHDADAFGTPPKLGRDDLLTLIREAGFRPVERNTRYEIMHEYPGPASAAHGDAQCAPA